MGLETAAMFAAGTQVAGGVSDFFAKKREADIIGTQGALARRRSEREQRAATGAQVAATGAAGVEMEGSTLDLIRQTDVEYELDQANIAESTSLAQKAAEREGMMSLISGVAGAAGTFAEAMPTTAKPSLTSPASVTQFPVGTMNPYGASIRGASTATSPIGWGIGFKKKPTDYSTWGVKLK